MFFFQVINLVRFKTQTLSLGKQLEYQFISLILADLLVVCPIYVNNLEVGQRFGEFIKNLWFLFSLTFIFQWLRLGFQAITTAGFLLEC